MKQKSKAILTVASTVLVISMLLLTAPVHAVTLSMELPSSAATGSEVKFDLKTDIAAGENIPIDSVTLLLSGPSGTQKCVFQPDGTPISGCDGLSITLKDDANYTQANRWGSGWDGNADFNTSFGYGYGFGATQSNAELTWTIAWNTNKAQAGEYTVDYYLSSSGNQVSRDYRLQDAGTITLAGSDAKVAVCHADGANGHTITIARSAVAAHLAHGDSLGACQSVSSSKQK
jgi:hypothetical protein